MSKASIQSLIEQVRNETQLHGNTRERIASLLTQLNSEKTDRADVESIISEITNISPLFFDQFGNILSYLTAGWTEQTAYEADGSKLVKKITGYTGATGTIPEMLSVNIGKYYKADGTLTTVKAEGANFRGDVGQAIINNNTYNLDPGQIVPSEALYNDTPETLAGDVLKRVDKTTGIDVNYRETTVWDDGSEMTDAKADGVIYIKKNNKYSKREFEGVFNVKWFGAKGDTDANDSGTDDTLAIQNAIDRASEIYKKNDFSGGTFFGGMSVYLPQGRYKISSTLILKDGVNLIGENKVNTNIHCASSMIAISNVSGYDSNGDIMASKDNIICDLTLTQGGIELIQSVSSRFERLRIQNLYGSFPHGLIIKIPVNVLFDDIKITGSEGVGVQYHDNAGTGPSTTAYFNRIWASHCNIGFYLNGGTTGSHAIINSSFNNIISEYNDIGLKIEGNVETCTFKTWHLEQNALSVRVEGSCEASFEDFWDDSFGGFRIYGGTNTEKARISIKNVDSQIAIYPGFKGELYLDGKFDLPGFPPDCKIYNNKGLRGPSGARLDADKGFEFYDTQKNTPTWSNGTSYRNADGFSADKPRVGNTSERPGGIDPWFPYIDTTLGKPIWWNGNNWVDAMGTTV